MIDIKLKKEAQHRRRMRLVNKALMVAPDKLQSFGRDFKKIWREAYLEYQVKEGLATPETILDFEAKKKLKRTISTKSSIQATLGAVLIRNGERYNFGTICERKVTTEFVEFLVDQLQTETSAIGDFKYHLSGTGVGAEAVSDTALGTPIGTAREVGTQAEGATAEIYRSVATIAYTDTYAVTEHAIFNEAYAAAQADGILLDRSVFAAINVVNADSVEYTYELSVQDEV